MQAIHYAIERQPIEEQLRQQTLRERLLGKTIERIRSSIDAASILQSTVAEVRQFLKTDRVLIYRCQDWASPLDGEEQKGTIVAGDRKHPGYKPPDSFRKQTQDREIKNLYPMKLAERIYPWGQCFNLKSKI